MSAIFTTGYPNVYAISKCFTSVYRSDYDSTESDIISIKVLNGKLDDVILIAKDIIKLVLNSIAFLPKRNYQLPEEISVISDLNLLTNEKIVDPVIFKSQTLPTSDRLFGNRNIEIFTYCLPFRKYNGRKQVVEQDGSYVIVCDGAEEKFEDDLRIATLTIHLNRFVKLIHDFLYPEKVPSFRTLIDHGI
ncbi:hypothetical protein JYU16_01170 [bacterium AH-315-M05]|nr:hypothetical protein [bacterium AH-315-M05]